MPPGDSIGDLAAPLRIAIGSALLRKLERLQFADQFSVTAHPGSTRVRRATQTTGLEMANYKPYDPGDDLRHLDWNAYGRIGQKLTKRFEAEREAPLHLLLDGSASMAVPAADGKLAFAVTLAVGLGYIGLCRGSPVRAAVLGASARSGISPLLRHAQRLGELVAFLSALQAGGPTRLAEGTAAYLRSTGLPGTAIVISDFLVDAPTYERALEHLGGRGYHVVALRVLGPHERDPARLPRRVRLHDVETGTERLVDLIPAYRARYADALRTHVETLRRWCDRRAIAYATLDPSSGIEHAFLATLTRAGVLR